MEKMYYIAYVENESNAFEHSSLGLIDKSSFRR
jgi:hypothetical protein